ncbi:hypothetical protein ScalyP_jg11015 [Parmales sp. scaly parma]|nr:hypothetical protein ScalyP_jg11015 [Parmales sp. scaly parma]
MTYALSCTLGPLTGSTSSASWSAGTTTAVTSVHGPTQIGNRRDLEVATDGVYNRCYQLSTQSKDDDDDTPSPTNDTNTSTIRLTITPPRLSSLIPSILPPLRSLLLPHLPPHAHLHINSTITGGEEQEGECMAAVVNSIFMAVVGDGGNASDGWFGASTTGEYTVIVTDEKGSGNNSDDNDLEILSIHTHPKLDGNEDKILVPSSSVFIAVKEAAEKARGEVKSFGRKVLAERDARLRKTVFA